MYSQYHKKKKYDTDRPLGRKETSETSNTEI